MANNATSDYATEKSEAVATCVAALKALSDKQRLEVFWEFCVHCGRMQPAAGRCQCSNDE